jgi:CubicO group peptidase (beta-lactamase class C family)
MRPRIPTRSIAVFAAVLAGFPAAGLEARNDASEQVWIPVADAPDLEGLHERWATAAEDLGVPGFSVAIVKDRRLYAVDSYGYGGAHQTHPIDPHTMFYIASITKTYTALTLATLADAGMVDLDEPVKTYLPRFELADPEMTDSVTVRDLLGHRPGINHGSIVFLDAYTGQITEDRFYQFLAEAEPRGEVTYTNVHFTIAGRVIEAVTEVKWQDVLQAEVFDPCGMTRTTAYASRMYGDPNCAFPMIEEDSQWIESSQRKTDRVMHAAGGMGTTAIDAARWIEVHLRRGQVGDELIFSPDVIHQMLEEQTHLPQPDGSIRRTTGFGLGWFRGTYRGRPYAHHGGGYVGTAAHLSFLPEEGLGVVVLTNSSPGGAALGTIVSIDAYDRLLGEMGHPDLLPDYVTSSQESRVQQQEQRAALLAAPPITAERLGVDLGRCAGLFGHPDLGEIRFAIDEDAFVASYGDLRLYLTDRDLLGACHAVSEPGFEYDIQFDPAGEGPIDVVLVGGETYRRMDGVPGG